MSKFASRALYLIGILLMIVVYLIQFISLDSPPPALNALFVVLFIIASILIFIAWVGALIKTARLGRWGWFVCLFFFSAITLPLSIFWGPRTRACPHLGIVMLGV